MIAPWRFAGRLVDRACFDPVTALASVAAIGTAVSAVGSIASGQAQANAASYNAKVDQNNAIQANQAANAQAEVSEQQTQQKLGQQKAEIAASGVDVNTGSPVDVMSSTAAQGKLDALTLRYGGQVRAQGDQQAGVLSTLQGQSAVTASAFNAGSTLLTGAGKTLSAAGYTPTSASW